MDKKEFTASYDRDSKRYHRFLIDSGQNITGSIYLPKDQKVPEEIVIRLRAKDSK